MTRSVRSILTLRAFAAALVVALATPLTAACRDDVVDLRWQGGKARFSVEIADDAAERSLGLMNREHLPTGAGMLFIYDAPGPVAFWMRNTLIPLDMIFAAPDGTVTRIHENARPLDETPIPGGDGVQLVLEINGGLSRRLGLREGAQLRHSAIAPEIAAWPCDAP